MLLAEVGSVAVAVVVAVMLPVAVGFTVMVIVALPALARPPSAHVTVGAAIAYEPWLGGRRKDGAVRAPDRVVVALTPVAASGPLLATVAV